MILKHAIACRFFLFSISWAIFQPYWGVWLTGRGFGPSEIGLAVGASLFARAVSVGLIFPLVNQHLSLLQLGCSLPWIVTFSASFYFFVEGLPSLILVSLAFGLIYPVLLPLYEASATIAARSGLLSYGPTRSLGSAGYIAGTLAAGWITLWFGSAYLPAILFTASLLLATLTFWSSPDSDVLTVRGTGLRATAFLCRDRAFLAVLAVATAIQASHAAYYSFAAVRLSAVAPAAAVPFAIILAPLSEFFLFLFARRRLEGFGVRTLFTIGMVSAVVRWSVSAMTDNWISFCVFQLLHAGSYAVTHLAFALHVRDNVRPPLQSSAHGLYAAFAMGLGTAFLTLVAGWLLEQSDFASFLAMALCAVCPLFLLANIPNNREVLHETA